MLDKTHLSLFSEKRLTNCINDIGFQEVARNDFSMELSDQHFPADSTFLSSSTTVYQYFNHIKQLVDPFATVNQFVRAYVPLEKNHEKVEQSVASRPFLSIITRTQGKRIEALSEVLLCLTVQTNTDFEVLIIGHKLNIERQIAVERVIEELPDWIREKVRLIRVDHGTRTTPLNIGFEKASGEYISILDDDDIVFDNWVEEFYNLAQKYPGTILHSYALLQDWEVVDIDGAKALRASGQPKDVYCRDFNLLNQLNGNFCPCMSYACPSYAFKKLGIRFNEELTTTEDWDFLMRTALVTGVSNSQQVTSLYRIWKNGENSYATHSKKDWLFNEQFIRESFEKMPIVLPAGLLSELQDLVSAEAQNQAALQLNEIPQRQLHPTVRALAQSFLFVDEGDGFSQETALQGAYNRASKVLAFEDFGDEKIYSIRFDPTDAGQIWVSNIEINVVTRSGDLLSYTIENVKTNDLKMVCSFSEETRK